MAEPVLRVVAGMQEALVPLRRRAGIRDPDALFEVTGAFGGELLVLWRALSSSAWNAHV